MMDKKIYCLGFDTSNYTTSAAIIDDEFNIVSDSRYILKVRQGDRGLRQSQALFEHIGNLPLVINKMGFDEKKSPISVIAVSDKPRQVEGSYMPVFKAGETVGKCVALITGAEYFSFSHQEGHIEAAKSSSGFDGVGDFLCFHISGGTTEVLRCRYNSDSCGYFTEIAGGTRDISLGQLIDRTGVSLGMSFPCGKLMDGYAYNMRNDSNLEFCKIKVQDGMMNISGIETQIQRYIEAEIENKTISDEMIGKVARALFFRIGEAIKNSIYQVRDKTGIIPVVIVGGVASSRYIREFLSSEKDIYFGKPELSSDNAVGTAMLGMKMYLKEVLE